MLIKHLVLSGGGPSMIQTIGALQHLEQNNIIQRENIQSIYGTSAGAIVGAIYCLQFDWETIYDYIIKRPWHEVFPVKIQNIFDAYTKKGIFDANTFEKCFKPLLHAKDFDLQITLKELYEFSKIELHMFAFELNEFHLVDLSFKTHPDLKLLTAIQMTCALPVLIAPVLINECCYIDGGVECNYPLKYCLENFPHDKDNILGFKNNYAQTENNTIHAKSTLLDFIMNFLFKILLTFNVDSKQPSLNYEIIYNTKYMSIEYLKQSLKDVDTRKTLYQNGIDNVIEFMKKLAKN